MVRDKHDASPKAISERTSYYQVRLAFHSLPQVIRRRYTIYRFGPPFRFRETSSCSWQAHLASGLMHTTLPHRGGVICAINTRFPFGCAVLASLASQYK